MADLTVDNLTVQGNMAVQGVGTIQGDHVLQGNLDVQGDLAGPAVESIQQHSVRILRKTVGFADIAPIAAQNWKNTLSITGGVPSSGVFTVETDPLYSTGTFGPFVDIPWNATVSDVQAILDAALDPGNGLASGTALPGGTITIETIGDYYGNYYTPLVVTATTLNAGTVVSTRTQNGKAALNGILAYTLQQDELLLWAFTYYEEAFDDSSGSDLRLVTHQEADSVEQKPYSEIKPSLINPADDHLGLGFVPLQWGSPSGSPPGYTNALWIGRQQNITALKGTGPDHEDEPLPLYLAVFPFEDAWNYDGSTGIAVCLLAVATITDL